MILVISRVFRASLDADGEHVCSIGKGLLVYGGISENDTEENILKAADKVVNLRIFPNDEGKMFHSVKDIGGDILAVSQFTLYASTVKGNRPSYIKAAKPDVAVPLYERFLAALEANMEKPVGRGIFGADMKVSLLNDGPVTIIIDSKLKF